MTFKTEQELKRGKLDIIIDVDSVTGERRIGVYSGETLLALKFYPTLDTVVDRLIKTARQLEPQFRGERV